jgi:hypothetical protein
VALELVGAAVGVADGRHATDIVLAAVVGERFQATRGDRPRNVPASFSPIAFRRSCRSSAQTDTQGPASPGLQVAFASLSGASHETVAQDGPRAAGPNFSV